MGSTNTDILVVGSGVIGLSIARKLKMAGAGRVTIIERSRAGTESSWAAAGMLSPSIEAGQNADALELGRRSLALYPALASELLNETGIDIGLDRTGTLRVRFEPNAPEMDDDGEPVTAAELRSLEPALSPEITEGHRHALDWQVDNRLLVAALLSSCKRYGVEVLEHTEAIEIHADDGRVTSLSTSRGDLTADTFVFAAGAWTSGLLATASMDVGVTPIKGQIIAFATGEEIIRHVIVGPDVYLVPRRDGRIIAGATVEDAGFDKCVTADTVSQLAAAARRVVPTLAGRAVSEAWCGLRPFSRSGSPVIGEIPGLDNAFVAAGHFRNGILLAPVTAEIGVGQIVGDRDTADLGKDEATATSVGPTNHRSARSV